MRINNNPQSYCSAQIITLGKSRKILLPKHFAIELPYYFVEYASPPRHGVQWLGICHVEAFSTLIAECGCGLRVLSEHNTYRPTIPLAICEKFALVPGQQLWLTNNGGSFELWSEKAWMELQDAMFAEFLFDFPLSE